MSLSADDSRKLAHLLRRAGFGARPSEWKAYAKLGLAGTTDRLLHPEAIPEQMSSLVQEISGDYVDFDSIDSLRKWWAFRMLHTPRPLEEKMTLFWHNHFATANFKVDNPRWMWQQNELFRSHALGNFRNLLQAVSRDPAMLVWLDGAENRKGRPNENYGRELLELFTLGIGGGYTETDVKEAARAFTGWQFDRDSSMFVFNAGQHDDGVKTFLGQTGNFNGDDIIDIVVRHPSTAKFVCTKLFKFFIHDDPTPAEVAPFVAAYFHSGYDMRAVVGAMLTSPVFYSPAAYYNKIKSPAEFTVTTLRCLDASMSAANNNLFGAMRGMGQELFNPPNVKGWLEGQAWINTMTVLARINFVSQLTNEMSRRGMVADSLRGCLQAMGENGPLSTPDQLVDAVWGALLPGHTPSPKTRAALIDYVRDGAHPDQAHFDRSAQGLLTLVLSAPEYHLA
ncbi:MAG: DUF1800 domain-containing protein [Armatimonadota bacterium]|nr:DUF1800 domain-containing protein [Armatimonadota bacterium]